MDVDGKPRSGQPLRQCVEEPPRDSKSAMVGPGLAPPVPPPPPGSSSQRGSPSLWARVEGYLRARPILCLAILTPGIPEYLSTSSPVLILVVNPIAFLLFLSVNVGQYTAGALLVREAMIRWNKGWATTFLLATAYGLTEEGLGDNTLFNATHGQDGVLGIYGHFAGVNWVWATGVLAYHITLSIGVPILLLGLALPATRGRSLLTRRGIGFCVGTLSVATAAETAIVWGTYHFWMGTPLLGGTLAAIAVLVVVASRLPTDAWRPLNEFPTLSPVGAFLVGFLVFPIAFLIEYGSASTPVPAFVAILATVGAFAGLLEIVRRGIGRRQNEYLLVHLGFGFVTFISIFGLLLTLGLPYTLPLVAVAGAFFVRMRRRYAPSVSNAIPGGVLGVL
jgi:hypothetical protein